MNEKTRNALSELAKAAAKSQGWNENEIVISVCEPQSKQCEGQCDFKEEYYGNRCTICGLFYAHGQAPWEFDEDAEYQANQEEYYLNNGTCEHCFNQFGDGWSNCICEFDEQGNWIGFDAECEFCGESDPDKCPHFGELK